MKQSLVRRSRLGDPVLMKRMSVTLDRELLHEAVRLSGGKSNSGTIELALRLFVRRMQALRIFELQGSGLWIGDLDAMRGKTASRARRKTRRRKPRGT